MDYGGGNERIEGYAVQVIDPTLAGRARLTLSLVMRLAREAYRYNRRGQQEQAVFGPATRVRVTVETWHDIPESDKPLTRPVH